MPIYDYTCKRCGHRFEQLVNRDEAPACPACGAARPEREFPTSATVSTVRMRERSLAVARGKAGAVKKEKDHAHAAYLREHAKDHGG
jgi:putative FmdB family regulatory protein